MRDCVHYDYMMYVLIFIMPACGSVLENELGVYVKTYVMGILYRTRRKAPC